MSKSIATSAQISEIEWKKLDKLYSGMESSMINWCIAVSHLEDRQEEISDRFGIERSAIARMIIIGENADKFVINDHKTIKNLPSGYNQLYLLADLNKTQIKEACKDGVPTRAKLRAYRESLGLVKKQAVNVIAKYNPDFEKRSERKGNIVSLPYYLFDLHDDCSTETVKILAKHWKQKYHPDKGGDNDIFQRICEAEKAILNARGES